VLTLFPRIFSSFLSESLLQKALARRLLEINVIDLRDYTGDRHRTADGRPYGGGPGMVMMAEPIALALEGVSARTGGKPLTAALSPGGELFCQKTAESFAREKDIALVCGRYAGIDQRAIDLFCDLELSVGSYVLNGGEVPAMMVMEACARLVPGFLGDHESKDSDSFSSGILESPVYTRPRVFRGLAVPEVLLSGSHRDIAEWRKKEALRRTLKSRPDLVGGEGEPG
jgi:tRNA (guanine37-N1)-methyltransferase